MEIKIKDFILNEIPNKDNTPKTPTQRKKPEITFTLEYENDSDFILKRTTPKTEKLLVVLVSQGQVYIKDVKANTVEKVTDIDQIRNFRKGMKDIPKFEKLTWTPFDLWYEYEHFKRLLSHTDACKILMNRKVNPFTDYSMFNTYRFSAEQFEKDLPYLKTAQLINPDATLTTCRDFLNTLKTAKITHNQIKDNLNTIAEIDDYWFVNFMEHNQSHLIFDTYLCDFKTFVEYLAYTIKHRNCLSVSKYQRNAEFNPSDYVDYLDMQQQMYGKVKEKYPENWLSDKHRMNEKYTSWKALNRNAEYTLHQEQFAQRVAYENELFKVVVPLKNIDILDEAEQQRHCVASYIDKVRYGNTHIVFIRLKDAPEESLLTVEINTDDVICQVRGFQNRMYNRVEYDFMKEFAEAKKLKLGVPECQNTDCTN